MLAVSSASKISDNTCSVYSENPQGEWDLLKSIYSYFHLMLIDPHIRRIMTNR